MDRIALLNEVLQQNPNDSFARYGLALEYANAGEVERALAEFETILSVNPDYVPAYQMSAQSLLTAGRSEEARQRLEAGISCAQRTGNRHAESEMQAMLDDMI